MSTTNDSAAKPATQNTILIPTDQIQVSGLNPRKTFDPQKLQEMADSMKAIGSNTTAGLVRVTPAEHFKEPAGRFYELVCGERRWRACQLAGLPFLAMVRELTDKEAMIQMSLENLHREDLTALEEAEGFRTLMEKFGYTADQVADEMKISRSDVFGKLRLLKLSEPVLKALREGKIHASVADLLSKFRPELQPEVLKEVLPQEWEKDPVPFRRCKETLEGFWPKLSNAQFKTTDADLVPAAGSCATCPKRSGNMPDMEGVAKDDRLCTDRHCFQGKLAAWRDVTLDKLAKQGKPVLDGASHKNLFKGGYNNSPGSKSGYESANNRVYEAKKQGTWAELLKKTEVPLLHAIAPDGSVILVVDKKLATEALVKSGQIKKAKEAGSSAAEDKKKREEAKVEQAVADAALAALKEVAGKMDGPTFLAHFLTAPSDYSSRSAIEAFTCTKEKDKGFKVLLEAAPAAIQELMVSMHCLQSNGQASSYWVPVWAKAFGVDLKAIEKRTKAELKANALVKYVQEGAKKRNEAAGKKATEATAAEATTPAGKSKSKSTKPKKPAKAAKGGKGK